MEPDVGDVVLWAGVEGERSGLVREVASCEGDLPGVGVDGDGVAEVANVGVIARQACNVLIRVQLHLKGSAGVSICAPEGHCIAIMEAGARVVVVVDGAIPRSIGELKHKGVNHKAFAEHDPGRRVDGGHVSDRRILGNGER